VSHLKGQGIFSAIPKKYWLFCMGLGLLALLWVADATLDALILHQTNFQDALTRVDEEQVIIGAGTVALVAIYFAGAYRARKRSQVQLKESEKKYRELVELAYDGIWVLNSEAETTFANKRMAEILGYRLEDMIGKPLETFLVGQGTGFAQSSIRWNQSRTGERHNVELLAKDGRRVFASMSVSPLSGEEGSQQGALAIVTDVTAQRLAEEGKYRSEERYGKVYSTSPLAFVICDPSFKIVDWNDKAEELFGWKKNEVLGRDFFEFLVREPMEAAIPEIQASVVEDRLPRFMVNRSATKSGQAIICEWYNSPLHNNDGELEGIISLGLDITKRKEAEGQIKAALEEKEILLREIHHRVKNNLQVISTLLDLRADGIADANALKVFKDSQNRVRAMALIHERLYQSASLARVDFHAYIQDLMAHLFYVFGVSPGDVQLSLNINEVPMSVDAAIPIGLILNELVSNSLKYAFPGGRRGTIRIALERHPELAVELTVGDDGAGLPSTVDFRNTESLGLQLVCILVRQLGGEIERVLGPGTTFKMTFKESAGRHMIKP
jgi:PAS domain S-box-containing protein